jgi:hypothetical protein
MLRGYGSFIFLKGINAYKGDLQSKYNVSVIFKVYDLSLFDIGQDLRSNSFEERGDDAIMSMTLNDPLGMSIGSILRPKGLK